MRYCPECHTDYGGTSIICPSCDVRLVKASRFKKGWAKLGDVLGKLANLKLAVHYCPRCKVRYPNHLVCPSCDLDLIIDNTRLRATIGGAIGTLAMPLILQSAHIATLLFGFGVGAVVGVVRFGKPGGPGGGGFGGDGGGFDVPDVGG
ncbi:MAG: hypothetical protein ABEK03_08350 [Candidatus Bipolaricaulia bacterium]